MLGFFPARVAMSHCIIVSSTHMGSCSGRPATSGIQVQPLFPWRSTRPCDIPSFGFAGQSTTVACSVMVVGPALSAFAIFHSSECADVENVPGGKGSGRSGKVFRAGRQRNRHETDRGIERDICHDFLIFLLAVSLYSSPQYADAMFNL